MPGHLLEWRSDSYRVRSYVSTPSTVRPSHSIEEACEELDHLLSESVREELVADVPVGIWLSGGLDSSTILYYAAKCLSQLRTFSITFRGRSFDEAKYIREVSRRFGTQHSDFDLNTSADLVSAIEQIAYHSDEPSADAGAVPLWFLAKLTKKNVTVVLTGEGADELLAGYLTYEADRYRAMASAVAMSWRKAALALAMRLPVSDEKIGFEYRLKRFLQGSLLSPDMAHVFWNGTFSEDEKRQFFRFADPRSLRSVLSTMNGGSGLDRYLDFDQKYYLPDDILYKVDRMSMAHSLEVRPPFLDPRIVDFAAELPGCEDGEHREIPLTKRLFELLSKSKQKEGLVFTFKENPITRIKTAWKGTLKRSEVKHYRFKDLRSTFNSRLLEAGIIKDVRKELMGHSRNEDTNDLYSHIELPLLREAIRKLEEWREGELQKLAKELDGQNPAETTDRSAHAGSAA